MSALLLFLFSYINDKHAADAVSEINTQTLLLFPHESKGTGNLWLFMNFY